MTRYTYLLLLTGLAVVLLVLRATLPDYSVSGVLLPRMEQVSLFVGLCVYGLPVIVGIRAAALGMRLPWSVAMFFWLTACEPLLRYLAGDYFAPTETIQTGYWIELAILALVLVAFLALNGRQELSARGRFFEGWASIVALISILLRPSVCFGNLSRLPVIGDVISYSGVFLTGLLRYENLMTSIKGLGLGFAWSAIGNSLLVMGFVGLLLMLRMSESEATR